MKNFSTKIAFLILVQFSFFYISKAQEPLNSNLMDSNLIEKQRQETEKKEEAKSFLSSAKQKTKNVGSWIKKNPGKFIGILVGLSAIGILTYKASSFFKNTEAPKTPKNDNEQFYDLLPSTMRDSTIDTSILSKELPDNYKKAIRFILSKNNLFIDHDVRNDVFRIALPNINIWNLILRRDQFDEYKKQIPNLANQRIFKTNT